MRFYECTFIIRQDLPAQDVHKLSEKYKGVVEKTGGQVIKKEYWGLRSLAYEIKKNKKGHYIFFGLKATPETITKVENDFKISEDVIKFLTIRVDRIDEKPSLMMQTPSETEK
ncbi:30S ribosomal protein S6 [Candidatus Bandiella euplotis]|uniref:Small ribosomal subunit protein bS6 n=1 Tax=Candidatus Bandiella euplotis TaxID=1664265 RepID=A0ABZ0UMZ7_9RICK|nr:30S ribosomal protein S6 [Candidatus Bandiella woodruffii]WPX96902.1 30S ribosomal protein S6 [Candidatus Bandiella woodruffii]